MKLLTLVSIWGKKQFFLSEALKLKFVKPSYFRPLRHHSFQKLMKFKISLKQMILETPICPIFWIFLKFTATISDKISLSKHDRSFDVSVNCKWHCNKACRGVADHLKKVNLCWLKMDDACITIRDKVNSYCVPYFRNHVDMTREIQSPSTKEWFGLILSFLKILRIFKICSITR